MPLETAKNRMAFQKADPVTGTAALFPLFLFICRHFFQLGQIFLQFRCSTVDSEHFILYKNS